MKEAGKIPGREEGGVGARAETAQRVRMFSERGTEANRLPWTAWLTAGVVVLAVIAGLLLLGRRKPAASANTLQPPAAYAASLTLSQLSMSESESLSGGRSTFLDGHVKNLGDKTVTSITVQVFFRNDEQMPPALQRVPLLLVRTHEPYVDTEAISADPLKPGSEREFRLIFESLPGNWNRQLPEIRIIEVSTR